MAALRRELKCWKIRHEPPLLVSRIVEEEVTLKTSCRSNSTARWGGRRATQILLFECSASGVGRKEIEGGQDSNSFTNW